MEREIVTVTSIVEEKEAANETDQAEAMGCEVC